MAFLYSVLLQLLLPTSLSLMLLAVSVTLRRRPTVRRACRVLAVLILLVCGNGWVVSAMFRQLERQYVPPVPLPDADAIVVLSGGVLSRTAPRPTVEVADAGDRVLYGAQLYRERKAPLIVVTGNVGTGDFKARPEAEDMAELLQAIGVDEHAIVKEIKAQNTHQHAVNLCPLFQQRQITRVLLVTSALHMPRSIAAFRHVCPAVEYIPAPTDFRNTIAAPVAWYREAMNLLPTPRRLLDFSDAAHEYLGMTYYRLRGWI
jgi:uncharacterized SAM-binding protein YcdF (DUF218 family)